jgi:hypothetical protein
MATDARSVCADNSKWVHRIFLGGASAVPAPKSLPLYFSANKQQKLVEPFRDLTALLNADQACHFEVLDAYKLLHHGFVLEFLPGKRMRVIQSFVKCYTLKNWLVPGEPQDGLVHLDLEDCDYAQAKERYGGGKLLNEAKALEWLGYLQQIVDRFEIKDTSITKAEDYDMRNENVERAYRVIFGGAYDPKLKSHVAELKAYCVPRSQQLCQQARDDYDAALPVFRQRMQAYLEEQKAQNVIIPTVVDPRQLVQAIEWHRTRGWDLAIRHIENQIEQLEHLQQAKPLIKPQSSSAAAMAIEEANDYCDRSSETSLQDYRAVVDGTVLRGLAAGATISVAFKHQPGEDETRLGDRNRLVECMRVQQNQCIKWWIPIQTGGVAGYSLEKGEDEDWTIQGCVQTRVLFQHSKMFLMRFLPRVPTA